MIFLLLVLMLSALMFTYRVLTPYILHPAIICLAVFIFSSFFAAANYTKWGDISFLSLFVILSSVIMFVIGCVFGKKISIKFLSNTSNYKEYSIDEKYIAISKYKTFFVIIIMLIVTFFTYLDVKNLAGTTSRGLLQIVSNARYNLYVNSQAIQHNAILQQGLYICRVFAYLYVFELLYNRYVRKRRNSLINFFPIILYFIQAFLSTGRTEFIYIIYAILSIGYFIKMSQCNWKSSIDFRYSKKIFIGLCAFIFMFLIIANSRSKNEIDLFSTLSQYAGSSIKALDLYILRNGLGSKSIFWGEETQSLYFSVLNSFGVSRNTLKYVLEPIYINGMMTNIFTSLRRYIHDYGLLSTQLIMMFMGIFYSSFFRKLKCKKNFGLRIIIYSFLSYPLVELSIEERFLSNLLCPRTFFCLIYMVIFFRVLFKKYDYVGGTL
ncbi:oligosaccharide repeat unit polymerase [Kandleria vitulina]|uniref:O-antigen polymerase n=1 Tax=Kandleria vitulina TaxID=1630 RepID=UPI00088540C4|nr:O-antigen polymerase [Kandleria vitulina]SDL41561.1 oligosaccharide repeat unit polymerase [Kandleria vitulina]